MAQRNNETSVSECRPKSEHSRVNQVAHRQGTKNHSDTDSDEPPEEAELSSPILLMSQSVYRSVLAKLVWPPEQGGLLLGPKDHEAVTHFHFDGNSEGTGVSLTFDHAGLNEALKRYVAAGLDCKGYVHVHPPGCDRPSFGDIAAVRALFIKEKNRGLQRFLLPIVASGLLHPFIIERDDLAEVAKCARYARLVLF